MELENKFEQNGVKIFCEYKHGKDKDGKPIAYERIKVEFEVYAETPLKDDDDETFAVLNLETDRQMKKIGFDLDAYNPIFD